MTARNDKRLFAASSHVRAHVLGKQWMQLRSISSSKDFQSSSVDSFAQVSWSYVSTAISLAIAARLYTLAQKCMQLRPIFHMSDIFSDAI